MWKKFKKKLNGWYKFSKLRVVIDNIRKKL